MGSTENSGKIISIPKLSCLETYCLNIFDEEFNLLGRNRVKIKLLLTYLLTRKSLITRVVYGEIGGGEGAGRFIASGFDFIEPHNLRSAHSLKNQI